ncbi:MAG: hypothetical protein V7603_4956 [Micromonosporaceae bacterium]
MNGDPGEDSVTTDEVLFTALPNGLDGTRARLSVLVSPRLRPPAGGGQAGLDGSDFADWPAHLQPGRVSFTVRVPGRAPVPAEIASRPPDSPLWTTLFGTTPVRPHAFEDLSDRAVATYPATALHDHIKRGHQSLARASAVRLPGGKVVAASFSGLVDALRPAPGAARVEEHALDEPTRLRAAHAGMAADVLRPDGVRSLAQRVADAVAVASRLARLDPTAHTPVIPHDATPASALAQLVAFHRGAATAAGAPLTGPPPRLDFHQALTFLADYPQLMRRLGLVIDLVLPQDGLAGAPPGALLQAVPAFTPPIAATALCPYTAFQLAPGELFRATPSGTEVTGGLLNLALPGLFALHHLDLDGAGLKLLNTLGGLVSAGPDDDPSLGVPALSSSGINIVHSGRGAALSAHLDTAAANNRQLEQGRLPNLYAEDLIRGYRFDVWDNRTGRWHSLHHRVVTAKLTASPVTPFDQRLDPDEGVSQPAVTRPPAKDSTQPDDGSPLYAHEAILHWRGWSLAVPRPGRTIMFDGTVGDADSQPPPGGLPIQISAQIAPGTLPLLRFGAEYRFRARTVDLTGNSLTVDEADQALRGYDVATVPVLPGGAGTLHYGRHEPVISPTLVPREDFIEGEALERLVIRSGPAAEVAYRPTCERHVVAPKTSQHMAELLGTFDAAFQQGAPEADIKATYVASVRSGGRLNAVHHEAQLVLPYLPDPLSRGAALFGVPGIPAGERWTLDAAGRFTTARSSLPDQTLGQLGGSILHIDFGDGWPARLPFRFVLAEPDHSAQPPFPPRWDPASRVLTVFLDKAEQANVRLSSGLATSGQPQDTSGLDALAVWQWVKDASQPPPAAVQTALEGGLWQLTPYRTISLVHAVEQPLKAPQVTSIQTPRDPGATFTYLGAEIPVHGKSTAKLDVLAYWTEPVDTVDGRVDAQHSAHLFEVPITVDSVPTPGTVPAGIYRPDKDSVSLLLPAGRSAHETYLSRHDFGDTKRRIVRYQAVATSRFREFFPQPVRDDAARISVTGDLSPAVDIPSAARPAAPHVVSAVPTFQWVRTRDGQARSSTRYSGVRVYLDRPWYSSGEGELLGVVLANPDQPVPDALAALVTRWAPDPIWQLDRPLAPPGPADFPGAADTTAGLALDEYAPPAFAGVHVAGFPVAFDGDRSLWYGDLNHLWDRGDEPAYHPFLRLALARYQPNSLPGLHLSRVAPADQVQLLPVRTMTLTPAGGTPGTYNLTVTGPAYLGPRGRPSRNPAHLIEVSVQRRLPGTVDDLGWVPADERSGRVTVAQAAIWEHGVLPGGTLWAGQVSLGGGRSAPGQVRILITEMQDLASDDPTGGTRRLVYVETVEL